MILEVCWTAFGHLYLGSHNFMVTAVGSCVTRGEILIPDFNERSAFKQLADWGRVQTACAHHEPRSPLADHRKLLLYASLLQVQTLGEAPRM
jgi:hypothetical protein